MKTLLSYSDVAASGLHTVLDGESLWQAAVKVAV